MGSDALVDLDQSCWLVLAKYNLVLTTVFGLVALLARAGLVPDPTTFLLVENTVAAILFGGVQTYAWISS